MKAAPDAYTKATRAMRRTLAALLLFWVVVAGLVYYRVDAATPAPVAGVAAVHATPTIPQRCKQYLRLITAETHNTFGPNGPISTVAAQVMQESGCNPTARSAVGAQGFSQFMPGTAADMAARYPTELGPADPTSPTWSTKAMVRYNRDNMRARAARDRRELPECAAWWFGLRDYNGGAGWTERDRRAARLAGANPDEPLAVEPYNAGRSTWNHVENTDYPHRIIGLWSAAFEAAGWGRPVVCSL